MTLSDPTIIALLFYSNNSLSRDRDKFPDVRLAHALGLHLEDEKPGNSYYRGKINQNLEVLLTSCIAHDAFILRLSLAIPKEGKGTSWKRLKQAMEDKLGNYVKNEIGSTPWAISTLYCASVQANSGKAQLTALYQALANVLGASLISDKPDSTPYGWFWTMTDRLNSVNHSLNIWHRDLLLLIPNDRAGKVQAYFTDSLQQGFSRIELYLQKCMHHTRQYEIIQLQLNQAMNTLQQEMVKQLGTLDFSQFHQEPVNLEQISKHLMRFLAQKATIEILLNSLRSNYSAYNEHLGRVKLETSQYTLKKNKISRQIEQMESDLHNANVIQESTHAIQDIQRAAEGSRFERASYLLGGTAGLLAVITFFNSFLDIWNLTLENSGWMMPASWLRILLSMIASISILLAATLLISRRKVNAIIAFMICFAAIAAMVLSTVLINI